MTTIPVLAEQTLPPNAQMCYGLVQEGALQVQGPDASAIAQKCDMGAREVLVMTPDAQNSKIDFEYVALEFYEYATIATYNVNQDMKSTCVQAQKGAPLAYDILAQHADADATQAATSYLAMITKHCSISS